MLPSIIFWMEAQANELVMNFLLGSQTGFVDIWLHQNSTDLTVTVLRKPHHAIGASIKILVMCPDTLKERRDIIVRISEIIEFNAIVS